MYIWGSTHGPKKSNTLSTLLRVIGMYSNNKNLIKINNNCFKKQSVKVIHLYPSRSLSPTGFLHLSVFQFLSSPVFLTFSFFPCLSPTPSFFFCRFPPVFFLSSSYLLFIFSISSSSETNFGRYFASSAPFFCEG